MTKKNKWQWLNIIDDDELGLLVGAFCALATYTDENRWNKKELNLWEKMEREELHRYEQKEKK